MFDLGFHLVDQGGQHVLHSVLEVGRHVFEQAVELVDHILDAATRLDPEPCAMLHPSRIAIALELFLDIAFKLIKFLQGLRAQEFVQDGVLRYLIIASFFTSVLNLLKLPRAITSNRIAVHINVRRSVPGI
ncbi:hypothetical protein A8E41_19990 [Burkholderia cenocepacia]|nr:hypothetical protein A8E06_24855 [Burkholderia cenocepacia]ONT34454.1 hypothetical protein A8E41_19990 [Burkholderia cenocepacia]